jgi:hypothetical protein
MTDEQKQAHNTMVVLPDGVIELVQTGYQTAQSSLQFSVQIDELVKQRRAAKQPAFILADISGITGHDSKVRDMAHDLLKSDFDKMALVTAANVTARLIGNWLVKIVGVGERVQFFEDRAEALAWLQN